MTQQQLKARRHHEKMKKQRIRQRKKKIQLLVWMELTIVIALISFICGKKAGEAKVSSTQTGNVANYGSGNQDDLDVTGGLLNNENDSEKNQTKSQKDKPELILVNKQNKLPEDYEVELKTLPDGVHKAAEIAYQPMCDMLRAGQKTGLRFEVCSSYRSVERQQELLDEDINALMAKGYSYKEAYAEVTRETMPPGYSEHSTGLAFDIVAKDYQMLDAKQSTTAENKWLLKHCAEYGFILRYPDDKEEVTGISYESWHFRYVGKDVAAYIMENKITLEEYLEEETL